MIEVLKTAQCFAPVDGSVEFMYTRILFRQDGITFCARSPDRFGGREVDVNKLENVRPIPSESYCPLLPSNCAIAPDPDRCYIKKPNLTSFDGGEDLASFVLQELATCEIIRKQPHRNIATYYGCQISDGRIIGLCFERYRENLMDRINPGHLNKSMFILSGDRAAERKKAAHYLPGIEQGIRHLHGLGRIHNDINPANIVISEDDTPVIIDFDTSSVPGTELDKAKRTYGWFDPHVCVSQKSNDFDALAELRVWLTGSSPAEFQFGW
ncbi:hypothetical protein BU26DRAFT_522277 [Trematosphaeria pertusa]|uniref:Protein kinase domain-containing protein n=1 Tax=Trematosphaeria pertusa TaxID=390896 RepID=A0A6A6I4E0_9PLEO|nr:uncharacterized protein BU26DRAFT_522277 [Trematosphaeria pertusa]KAF2245167.1 hypothetical protein BU26DRAFT_522277 [Trematosphaeria pertusa]